MRLGRGNSLVGAWPVVGAVSALFLTGNFNKKSVSGQGKGPAVDGEAATGMKMHKCIKNWPAYK